MTARVPRPSLSSKRPLSAIFIGSGSGSPVHLPDLPEPPIEHSPTSSSGLPSPPATNSTGSGSAKDAGSVRRTLTGSETTTAANVGAPTHTVTFAQDLKGARHSRDSSEEEDVDDGGDHTAKLTLSDDRRMPLKPRHSDNMSALQRVKNLTQRNRTVRLGGC